jgi:hypothetical protein
MLPRASGKITERSDLLWITLVYLKQLDASHHNLSSGFVASQMFVKIVENPAYEPKSIILAIEEKFR